MRKRPISTRLRNCLLLYTIVAMSQVHQRRDFSEEEALHYLVAWIDRSAPRRDHAGEPHVGHEIYIPHVLEDYLRAQRHRSHQSQPYTGPGSYQLVTVTNAAPFYAAAWGTYACEASCDPASHNHNGRSSTRESSAAGAH